jgi:hypothetical protein
MHMDVLDFCHVRDRRSHRRFTTRLSGTVYFGGGRGAQCSVLDISPAGAAVRCAGPTGENIRTLMAANIGEVHVARSFCDMSVTRLAFEAGDQAQSRIDEVLRSLGEQNLARPAAPRRRERLKVSHTLVIRRDGSHGFCEIRDVSVDGMSLRGAIRPPIGEHLAIGRAVGRVVRHCDDGFAVQLVKDEPSNVVRFPVPYRPRAPEPTFDDIA